MRARARFVAPAPTGSMSFALRERFGRVGTWTDDGKGQRVRVLVKARHGHVNDSVKTYAEEKLGKLARRVHNLTVIELILWREHNPSIADDHAAEAIVHTKGPNIVAREHAGSWEAAIDRLIDKLERQVERHRDMKTHERRRRAPREQAVPDEDLSTVVELGAEESAA
jgi:putative sigma-54 modulation protein